MSVPGSWIQRIAVVAALSVSGCAVPHRDLANLSTELQQRSGYSLTNGRPGEIQLPPNVSLADGLTEDEAVAVALWNNAAFQETLADLGLSRADLVQAAQLPNPTFSMLFPIGAKPLEVTAKYPLEILWLRRSRVVAAKLDLDRTAHQLVQSGLDLIRDVRVAFADLSLADRQLSLAGTDLELSQSVAEQMQARWRAGEASELEADSARVEVLQSQETLARAQREARMSRERLLSLAGLDAAHQPASWPDPPLPQPSFEPTDLLVTNALALRPDLLAAALGLEAAGRRIGMATTEVYTFSAAINAKEVGRDLLAGPGLDIPVPIFNQNQGGVALAKARFDKAARHYIAVRDRIILEVRETHLRFEQARASSERWHQRILPDLKTAVRQAEKLHDSGEVTALYFLEHRRKLIDAQRQAAVAVADFRHARAELERCVGRRLNVDPPTHPVSSP